MFLLCIYIFSSLQTVKLPYYPSQSDVFQVFLSILMVMTTQSSVFLKESLNIIQDQLKSDFNTKMCGC